MPKQIPLREKQELNSKHDSNIKQIYEVSLVMCMYVAGGDTMSVKLKFESPADGGMVHRSRSFTGVNTLGSRRRYLRLYDKFLSIPLMNFWL